jgi:outer membrane lipoprotein-sorting protein
MKRVVITVFVAAAMVASAAAQAPAPATGQAAAPTVDELLAKNTTARGGADKLKAIDTRKITGSVSAQGMDMTMTVYSKRPNLMLQEMEVAGRKIVTAFDGQKAWAINPMMGDTPQQLTGVQAELLGEQANFEGPLALARQRGDKMEVVGGESVEGENTWKLAITHDSRVTTVFIDQNTGLERKVSSNVTDGGMQLLIESFISDYQPTPEGIMVPRQVRTMIGGQQQTAVKISKIEFNVPIDEAMFKMPSSAQSTPVQ